MNPAGASVLAEQMLNNKGRREAAIRKAEERRLRELEEERAEAQAAIFAQMLNELEELVAEERRFCQEDGSPVEFHFVSSLACHVHPEERDDDDVEAAVHRYVGEMERYYIGSTTSPSWRWSGGESYTRAKPMEGHRTIFMMKWIFAARHGPAGGALEKCIIQSTAAAHPDKLNVNIAVDSRGTCRTGWNFLYVCT